MDGERGSPTRSGGHCLLDETDRAIIAVLERDARTSLRTIAEEVGVAQGTVSNRVKRLEAMGIVRGYGVDLDAALVGWTMTVVIGIRIVKGRLMEVQNKIAEDPRVHAVYDVTGDYDSMVIARARDRHDLNDFTKTVLSLDGIERSVTHLVLNTVKESNVGLPEPLGGE